MKHKEGRASERKFRVALFGAGKMAMHHAKAIHLQGNACLVAIADPALSDRDRLKGLEERIEIYSSAEDLLKQIKPDVVHICTPPATHATLAKLALDHGAHIYVEKPFTLSTQDAFEVINLAKDKRLQVCAGHQLLFESPALLADEILKKLGRIVHIESYFSFNPVRHSKDGRTAISPLEQLFDILPHPVYLLLHFMKKKSAQEEVRVHIRALEVKTSGSVHGILSFGDITGNLIVTLEGRPIESYIKAVGTNGCLYADFVRGTVVELPGPGKSAISKILNPYQQSRQIIFGTTKALYRRIFKKQKSYPGLFEIISNFYNNLQSDMPPTISATSIIETVTVCEDVAKKLAITELEENAIARKELDRLESELSPPDVSRGGVLITGGTGMLGKAVACELRRRNWYTRVVARKIPPVGSRIPGVDYVVADLSENISPEFFNNISIVIHCAAETAGGKDAHARNSVDATRNILVEMAKVGVKKFLHISSIAVLKSSREIGGSVAEDTPIDLDNEDRGPYVWGKAESERLARDLSQRLDIKIRVIRPGPLVNYNEFEAPGRLGREIGPYFIYMGSKKSKLNLCSIQTAAEVICKYTEDFDSMPLILNLLESESPTRAELVSRLLHIRPDLKVMRIPFYLLKILSPILKLLQRVLLRGRKPVDIYTAFASEEYDTKLSDQIIKNSIIPLRQ